MEINIEIESEGMKPDGFDDCISKTALDCARLRLKTVKTFGEVMEWDDRIFSAAMSLSVLLEIIGHATAATAAFDGTHEDSIKFVDHLADCMKKQIRGETVEF